MDDEYRRALIERVKPRFHGKETIRSRASWNRPDAAERDYKRLMRQQNTQKPQKKQCPAKRRTLPICGALFDLCQIKRRNPRRTR